MRYDGANILKTSDWRFIDDGGKSQLYDIVNDPNEFQNLYNDPAYAETVVSLRQQLFELTDYSTNESPTITLLGDATVTIDQGDAYADAGATADDLEDGDLTAQMKMK